MAQLLETLIPTHGPTGGARVDHAELAEQLEALHPHSFGWAMACCGRRREEAEDVLHDVYVKVLGGETRFDGRSALKTWLFGIVRRTAINQRRTQRLRALLGVRNARRIDGQEPQLTVPHEIVALVAWRPATDVLLVTPGNELLRSRPTLGTSLLGAMPARHQLGRRSAMRRIITLVALLATTRGVSLYAQGPQGQPGLQPDPFGRFLFPPELVMQHRAEGKKLARLLQGSTPDEAQVLEQVDRILAAEREVKRTQIGLLVRIKNALTPVQQAKLAKLAELSGPGRP